MVLQDVVLDPKLLEDMKHLTKFCHTGSLEVYHSLYNKYMPKRQHFSYKGMTARTMLAALDNNKHSGRQQATVQKGSTKGDLRFNVVHPKGREGWVAKPLYERKNYGYVQDMLGQVVDLCRAGADSSGCIPVPSNIPQNIAPEAKPPKDEVIRQHTSRF